MPIVATAQCNIELESIKPLAKEYLSSLHEQDNLLIKREDFEVAYSRLGQLIIVVDECQKYHHELELKNYHFTRWGENSDRYRHYSWELGSIQLQLKSSIDSYELGMFRSFFFNVDMWEKVVNEFYDKEI